MREIINNALHTRCMFYASVVVAVWPINSGDGLVASTKLLSVQPGN